VDGFMEPFLLRPNHEKSLPCQHGCNCDNFKHKTLISIVRAVVFVTSDSFPSGVLVMLPVSTTTGRMRNDSRVKVLTQLHLFT
jgi:hypothetical protein